MEPPFRYLDSNVLIHIMEPVAPLTPAQSLFLANLDAGSAFAITSELALSECLVKPFADRQNDVVENYLSLFATWNGFAVLAVTRDILIGAARLRAATRMSLPDAIHVATAKAAGCAIFVSDDRRIRTGSMKQTSWTSLEV